MTAPIPARALSARSIRRRMRVTAGIIMIVVMPGPASSWAAGVLGLFYFTGR